MRGDIEDFATSATGAAPAHEDELFLDERIFATHHRGAGSIFTIVVPPLFEEHARTRKVLVNIARELAAIGIDAVRFDYPGTGLSPGSTHDFTLAGAAAALRRAIAFARAQGATSVHLLGFRFGAYLAVSAARELPEARLVLWEPLLDLGSYFDELLRVELATQVATFGKIQRTRTQLVGSLRAGRSVLVDGNRLSPVLHDELVTAPPLALAAIADRALVLCWDNRKLHETARSLGVRSAFIEDVRFSWKHIRTLEPRSATLFALTRAGVRG
jgi:pimeloyl-ACP methyl ester carboxylesterase